MDTLPNRDTVAAFEARLGKPLMTVLIWLTAGGIAVGALGAIVAGIRAAIGFVYPLLPTTGWVRIAEQTAAVLVAVSMAFAAKSLVAAFQKLRRLENMTANQEATGEIIAAESERTTQIAKQLDALERRLAYVENKVGSEFIDVLTNRMLEERGVSVDDLARVKQLPARTLSRRRNASD